jgi:hypothetical protein
LSNRSDTYVAEMQLIVGPVGPRGQNFRGSGKCNVIVTTYVSDLLDNHFSMIIMMTTMSLLQRTYQTLKVVCFYCLFLADLFLSVYAKFREPVPIPDFILYPIGNRCKL